MSGRQWGAEDFIEEMKFGGHLSRGIGIPNLGRNQNGVEDWAVEGM